MNVLLSITADISKELLTSEVNEVSSGDDFLVNSIGLLGTASRISKKNEAFIHIHFLPIVDWVNNVCKKEIGFEYGLENPLSSEQFEKLSNELLSDISIMTKQIANESTAKSNNKVVMNKILGRMIGDNLSPGHYIESEFDVDLIFIDLSLIEIYLKKNQQLLKYNTNLVDMKFTLEAYTFSQKDLLVN